MKLERTHLVLGTLALTLVAFASSMGTIVAGNLLASRMKSSPVVLNADSASRGEQLSMATGFVDRDRGIEGLFVLDHLTGNIQCSIINPRNGEIGGIYVANVNKDLELGKAGDADFVMTTGAFRVEGRRGNERPADSICYVADGNSGRMVGYSLLYDKQSLLNNVQQQGALTVIARGLARAEGMKRDN